MQNAVAEQRVQGDALSGTTTISLREPRPGGPKKPRPEIEVIQEDLRGPAPLNGPDPVFCRDLLEFLGDFKSAGPKSSNVRRLGQAAAQDSLVTREPAPNQDLLVDFLRAYEAAPKLRLPSQLRPALGRPEPAGTATGPIATPATAPQTEDTPFRVPPYVSAVSDNTATDEGPDDPDGAWPEPQPAPAPVAQRLVAVPVAQRPTPVTVPQRPARAPVAKRPELVPVAQRPAPLPVARRPDPVPVAPRPAPAPVAKQPDRKPAPVPAAKRLAPKPAPAPAAKPLGPAAARAKAIAEGLIV